jgi:hypothetical protein
MKPRFALLAVLIFSAIAAAAPLAAQNQTEAIVQAFNKKKHSVKTRNGIRTEKYKEVRSEPAVRANPESYSGDYKVTDWGFDLSLTVDKNGNVSGHGSDPVSGHPGTRREFTLRNARIDGAALRGTRVFADGRTEPFEGVFLNRTDFDSPNDKGVKTFGLGVLGETFVVDGLTIEKLFYEKAR